MGIHGPRHLFSAAIALWLSLAAVAAPGPARVHTVKVDLVPLIRAAAEFPVQFERRRPEIRGVGNGHGTNGVHRGKRADHNICAVNAGEAWNRRGCAAETAADAQAFASRYGRAKTRSCRAEREILLG